MKLFLKRTVGVFLSVILVCSPFSVYAKEVGQEETVIEEGELYARAAVLMDAATGRILFGKNETEVLPMASTTKIMTLIVALEQGNLEDVVTVSDYAATMPDVQLNIKAGEKYILQDLLFSLMLESHNDTAVAIAEHIGGSVEGFAQLMNAKAKEIGCNNTCFITPNGLDATATLNAKTGEEKSVFHSTTAEDLAKIMSYCITESPKKDDFLRITRTASHSFSDCEGTRSFSCQNRNSFLNMMEEALSGKTGFTSKAGYCYVGSVKSGDRIYVVALLACGWPNNKTYKWKDMKKLSEYGMEKYELAYLDEEEVTKEIRENIPVENGIGNSLFKDAYVELKAVLAADSAKNGFLKDREEKIDIKVECPERINAPVSADTEVGKVTVELDGMVLREYEILTCKDVKVKNFGWFLEEITNIWLSFGKIK